MQCTKLLCENYERMSYITYILTKPICKMSFDDGVNISIADIGMGSSNLFYENSATFYEGGKLLLWIINWKET